MRPGSRSSSSRTGRGVQAAGLAAARRQAAGGRDDRLAGRGRARRGAGPAGRSRRPGSRSRCRPCRAAGSATWSRPGAGGRRAAAGSCPAGPGRPPRETRRDAAGGQHPLALGHGALGQLVRRVARLERRVDAVADVEQQLATLPGQDVGAFLGLEAGRAQVGGDRGRDARRCRRGCGRRRGCRGRGALGHDHARLQVGGRQHHAQAVDAAELTQCGRPRWRRRWSRRRSVVAGGACAAQVGEGRCGLVRLHGEDDGRVVGPVRPRRRCRWPVPRSGACRHPCPAAARPRGSPPGARRAPRASRAGPRQVQVAADHAADRPGAVHDVPHRLHPARPAGWPRPG